jgi:hypothetical protein
MRPVSSWVAAGLGGMEGFIEAPHHDDMPRLIEQLGLESYDPEYHPHAERLAARLDHPGIVAYNLTFQGPAGEWHRSHVIYEPDLHHPRGLPWVYARFRPELFNVIVDTRQPPRD